MIAVFLTYLSHYNHQRSSPTLFYRDNFPGNCAVTFGLYNGPSYRSPDRTIDTGNCIVQSKWMRVMQHKVRVTENLGQSKVLMDKVIDDWLWIDYHDRVNVLVHSSVRNHLGDDQFFVLRQTKYALEGRQSLAVVGGIIEPGDTAEATARREVHEELQAQCQSFYFLGRFRTDVNRGIGWVNSFLALNCHRKVDAITHELSIKADKDTNEVGKADTEEQEVTTLTLSQLREELRKGRFIEVQWSNTVALALLHDAFLK